MHTSGPDSDGGGSQQAVILDTDRMRRALAIACAALDEAESGRREWALSQCGEDLTLREEVLGLLAADRTPEDALTRPLESELLADPWPGRRLGRYRIIERIGSGGMGAVYRAQPEESVVRQPVALKLIKRGMDSEEILRRFLRERAILASLDHPHIARLLDGGMSEDGRPWFAMELVSGEPLLSWCDARKLPPGARIGLFLEVCDAVEHAHRNLVVHRDIKPGNVLVGADGQVKLLDFGIAKLIAAHGEEATRSVQAMLTPDYAAPEQYDRGPITTQTDVYLLGLLLADLLAGRQPRRQAEGVDGTRLLRLDAPLAAADAAQDPELRELAARRGQSVPQLARSLRGDLDRIVRRAQAPEPAQRYPGVGALAEDLRRHLRGEPVQAMPDDLRYRLGKFLRRHRGAVAAAAAVLGALAIGAALALNEARHARAAERQAETSLELLEDVFLGADPYYARAGDTKASDLLAGAAARIEAASDLSPALAARLWSKIGMAQVSVDQRAAAEQALGRAIAAATRACGECRDQPALRTLRSEAQARLAHFKLVLDGQASALAELEAVIATLREIGAPARAELAQALQIKSDYLFNSGQYQGLDALSAEVVALVRDLADEAPTQLIMALGNRASLLRASGDYQGSLVAAEEAWQRAEQLGEGISAGVRLYVDQQYGATLSYLGRPAQAEPRLRAAHQASLALRGPDGQSTLGLGYELADALSELGRNTEAAAELRVLIKHMGGSKGANVAAVHNALGRVLLGSGEASEALAQFDAAAGMLCGDAASPPCLAIWLNRADAAIAVGDLDDAQRRLAALAPAREAGGRLGMRWQLLHARLQLARGELDAAAAALAASRSAMAAAEADPVDRGHWLVVEARIAEGRGDRTAAREAWTRAQLAFRERWTGEPAVLTEIRAALERSL